jgi:hypothetical protein
MKILLVGSGGREHALADALSRENTNVDLIAAPGNPGIAEFARVVDVPVNDELQLTALAEREHVDLVIVGPEAPLAAGLVDQMQQRRIPVFGPTKAAAMIETSKADIDCCKRSRAFALWHSGCDQGIGTRRGQGRHRVRHTQRSGCRDRSHSG